MRLLPFLLAALWTGCVTTSRFQAQQSETEAQRKRADAAASELAALKTSDAAVLTQLASAKEQLASLQTQLASVQGSNKDLQQALEANKGELSRKVSELIKEKDAAAQKLLKESNDATELRRRLAEAEDARKALEQAKAAELEKVRANYEQLTSGLKSEIASKDITITQLHGRLTVNMLDRILFDSGRAEIKPDGMKVLEKVGQVLAGLSDKDIRIEGHTDNKPIVGELREKYPTNWELSTARATAVARTLEDRAKVDPKRLVAAGFGEYRPIAPNDTPENRALNRRIEIVLTPKE
jgi:chemotaxis protein MotB